MMNTNGILAAVQNIQPDAQAALPVIPNNGNPLGANNMPSVPTSAPQEEPNQLQPTRPTPMPSQHYYPWMNPSPYMEQFKQMFQPSAPVAQPAYTAQPVPQPQQALPVLPQRI